MNALERQLREIIAAEGPIPLERYMHYALAHPAHGYYMTRDPIGAAGDFDPAFHTAATGRARSPTTCPNWPARCTRRWGCHRWRMACCGPSTWPPCARCPPRRRTRPVRPAVRWPS